METTTASKLEVGWGGRREGGRKQGSKEKGRKQRGGWKERKDEIID